MHLAFDIGLAGLPLGVQGIELKVQIMFGGLAGVDGAAADLHPVHAALSCDWATFCPRPSRRPKNLGPFQFVPVMIRAMADRLE